jgi:hypothetical protein
MPRIVKMKSMIKMRMSSATMDPMMLPRIVNCFDTSGKLRKSFAKRTRRIARSTAIPPPPAQNTYTM